MLMMKNSIETDQLSKLLRLAETLGKKNPEMPLQTWKTLLLIAESGQDGILQNELPDKIGMGKTATFRNLRSLGRWKDVKNQAPGLDLLIIELPREDNRQRRVWLNDRGWKFIQELLDQIR